MVIDPTNPFTAARKRLAISREQFAEYLGVHLSTANQWEAGRRSPPAVALRLLELLAMIETMAPDLHRHLIPPPRAGKTPGPKPRSQAPAV